jgi:hypothetical protein
MFAVCAMTCLPAFSTGDANGGCFSALLSISLVIALSPRLRATST